MRFHVQRERRLGDKRLLANFALVRLVPGVRPQMHREGALVGEAFPANLAPVGALVRVYSLVVREQAPPAKSAPTSPALERLLASVQPQMIPQTLPSRNSFPADVAHGAQLLLSLPAVDEVLVVLVHVHLVAVLADVHAPTMVADELEALVLHFVVLLAVEVGVEAFAAFLALGAVVLRVSGVVDGQRLLVGEAFAAKVANELFGGVVVDSGNVAQHVVFAFELLVAQIARMCSVAVHHHVAEVRSSAGVRFEANVARDRLRLERRQERVGLERFRFYPGKESAFYTTLVACSGGVLTYRCFFFVQTRD